MRTLIFSELFFRLNVNPFIRRISVSVLLWQHLYSDNICFRLTLTTLIFGEYLFPSYFDSTYIWIMFVSVLSYFVNTYIQGTLNFFFWFPSYFDTLYFRNSYFRLALTTLLFGEHLFWSYFINNYIRGTFVSVSIWQDFNIFGEHLFLVLLWQQLYSGNICFRLNLTRLFKIFREHLFLVLLWQHLYLWGTFVLFLTLSLASRSAPFSMSFSIMSMLPFAAAQCKAVRSSWMKRM